MAWTIKITEVAGKQLKKLDKTAAKRILKYLKERIAASKDPTVFGKPLLHDKSGLWRYRVDDYRIICELRGKELVVLVLRVAHKKKCTMSE